MRQLQLALILSIALIAMAPALAWNAAGHMTIAALAWLEMQPAVRERATELLKQHPDFTKWQTSFNQGPKNIDFGAYLLMRASVWPDQIRRTGSPHDHPTWHYVNYPLRPPEFPMEPPLPQKEHVLFGIERCLSILNNTGADNESRAVHLAWLLHLIGDLHQPLHAVALVTDDYPKGDRGGNSFWVIANKAPVNLHSYWDGLLGRSRNMRELYNEAARLRVDYSDLSPRHRTPADPVQWAMESRQTAVEFVYLRGKLKGGMERERAVQLPENYLTEAKTRSEQRAYLASVRTAERLSEIFAQNL